MATSAGFYDRGMATSNAATVEEYMAGLEDDRRALVSTIRDIVNANLPVGYTEGMQYGMIGWFVPHSLYPSGYHTDPRQPLPLASLASQKQHVALYMMGTYCGIDEPGSSLTADAAWFRDAWLATGKKLDMGKSCLRIKRADAIATEVLAEAFRRLPVDVYIARYEAVRDRPTSR
jgi:hypothetical protein